MSTYINKNESNESKITLNQGNKKDGKPKKSIADDIERLKNRREERKKIDEAKKEKKDMVYQNQQDGKACDSEFENLIKKKKNSIAQTPDNVSIL